VQNIAEHSLGILEFLRLEYVHSLFSFDACINCTTTDLNWETNFRDAGCEFTSGKKFSGCRLLILGESFPFSNLLVILLFPRRKRGLSSYNFNWLGSINEETIGYMTFRYRLGEILILLSLLEQTNSLPIRHVHSRTAGAAGPPLINSISHGRGPIGHTLWKKVVLSSTILMETLQVGWDLKPQRVHIFH